MQNRGVPVCHADFVLYRFIAELISGPVNEALSDAATSHPQRETARIVVAARLLRACGMRRWRSSVPR